MFCKNNGTTYHLTVPYTPQLNGLSERMNRTITEKARTMLNGAKLNSIFWGEAVLTATFLINISPCKAIKENKTLFELWHKRKPEIKYLKVFGSTIYVHEKVKKSKFDDRSWKGIMVGYVPNGYKVYDCTSGKFETARDVVVDEENFIASRPKGQNYISDDNVDFYPDNKSDDASKHEQKSNDINNPDKKSDDENKPGTCKQIYLLNH